MPAFNFAVDQMPLWEPSGSNIWIGRVPVQVTKEEVKPTAAGNGNHMLVVTVKALAGEYAGQENQINFNLYNSNSTAVDMAQRQLAALARASGRHGITSSEQLVGAQFLAIYVPRTYTRTNKATGASEEVPSCQCDDYHLLTGQTVKEASAGQAASRPYDPNNEPRHGAAAPQAAPAPQAPPAQFAPQPQPGAPQPGFTPPAQPGSFAPPGPQPGFAPPAAGAMPASAGMPAMGQFGGQPAQQPGIGTAASGFSPPGSFAPPGGAPAPQPQFAPPGAGMAPGGAPQGPWNGAPAPGYPQR